MQPAWVDWHSMVFALFQLAFSSSLDHWEWYVCFLMTMKPVAFSRPGPILTSACRVGELTRVDSPVGVFSPPTTRLVVFYGQFQREEVEFLLRK